MRRTQLLSVRIHCTSPPAAAEADSNLVVEEATCVQGLPLEFVSQLLGEWRNVANSGISEYLKHLGIGWAQRKLAEERITPVYSRRAHSASPMLVLTISVLPCRRSNWRSPGQKSTATFKL